MGSEKLVNDIVVGEKYKLIHAGKGTAIVRVLEIDGEWIDVEVLQGRLQGIGAGSLVEVGDYDRVRDSHATFLPLRD